MKRRNLIKGAAAAAVATTVPAAIFAADTPPSGDGSLPNNNSNLQLILDFHPMAMLRRICEKAKEKDFYGPSYTESASRFSAHSYTPFPAMKGAPKGHWRHSMLWAGSTAEDLADKLHLPEALRCPVEQMHGVEMVCFVLGQNVRPVQVPGDSNLKWIAESRYASLYYILPDKTKLRFEIGKKEEYHGPRQPLAVDEYTSRFEAEWERASIIRLRGGLPEAVLEETKFNVQRFYRKTPPTERDVFGYPRDLS